MSSQLGEGTVIVDKDHRSELLRFRPRFSSCHKKWSLMQFLKYLRLSFKEVSKAVMLLHMNFAVQYGNCQACFMLAVRIKDWNVESQIHLCFFYRSNTETLDQEVWLEGRRQWYGIYCKSRWKYKDKEYHRKDWFWKCCCNNGSITLNFAPFVTSFIVIIFHEKETKFMFYSYGVCI